MIEDLIEDLKRDEGWSAYAYQDSLGFWTIGYGFLVDKRKEVGLPKSIGEEWLTQAAKERWNELTTRLPWILDQPDDVKRALGNMAYQLGVNGVRNFRRMLNALFVGDRKKAAEEAMNSHWAEQTPQRARRVAALLRG